MRPGERASRNVPLAGFDWPYWRIEALPVVAGFMSYTTFVSAVSRSHAGEREGEPGVGGGQPVVGRRGGHGGEVWHLEHLAPLGEFSERHDLSSDLELGLTPPAQSIINGRGTGEGVRMS